MSEDTATALKQYALEKAITVSSGNIFEADKIVEIAVKFEAFLTGQKEEEKLSNTENKKGNYLTVETPLGNRISHNLKELSKAEKVVLQKTIEFHCADKKISGGNIGSSLRPALTQSCVSMHLRNLVTKGYVKRPHSQTYIPIFNQSGNAVPVNIREMPVGYAKGYKPLRRDLLSSAQIEQLKKRSNNNTVATGTA